MKSYLKTGAVLLSTLGAISPPPAVSAQKAPIMEVDKKNDIIITPGPVYKGVKAHPATEAQKNEALQVRIAKHMKSSKDFKDLPDAIQKLIIENQGNYSKLGNYYVLFTNDEFRILIGQKGKLFALERLSFNRPEDILFVYDKEEIKKTWISFSKSELNAIQKNDKLTEDDKAYLKALLEITNENIQYLYGSDFKAHNLANTGRKNTTVPEEDLIGRYIPHKMLTHGAFDTQMDNDDLGKLYENPHLLALSTQLGRPVYDMRNFYDKSEKVITTGRCSTGGDGQIKLLDGHPWKLRYYTSIPFDEMNKSFQIATVGIDQVQEYMQALSKNIIEEMEKQGVDLTAPKNNNTPLKKVLYIYAAKTLDITHQIYVSPVHKKYDTAAVGVKFGKAESMAELIPLKRTSLSQASKKLPNIVSDFKKMDPYLKPQYLADLRAKPFVYEENKVRLASNQLNDKSKFNATNVSAQKQNTSQINQIPKTKD